MPWVFWALWTFLGYCVLPVWWDLFPFSLGIMCKFSPLDDYTYEFVAFSCDICEIDGNMRHPQAVFPFWPRPEPLCPEFICSRLMYNSNNGIHENGFIHQPNMPAICHSHINRIHHSLRKKPLILLNFHICLHNMKYCAALYISR